MASLATPDEIVQLARITTRNEHGEHFTAYNSGWERLEELGMIAVHRPVHHRTDIPYGQESWSLIVTQAGRDTVEVNH